ncbi:hypothetical protein LS71_005175 [Helicobacter jaachi]|uniref:Lipoprotein n=1 Tax=Helicobacter jaachi TaxID=1677920 RepID=A0A4U8TAY1_9HELI|nr:hypothetical protein LS71_005175 [Helicobacter jaachi]
MRIYSFCIIMIFFAGCSDFYRSNFVHIASTHDIPKVEKTLKERQIQAMRKSQILEHNHTRAIMITHYVNDIDAHLVDKNDGEVFFVEVYDKEHQISQNQLTFKLTNPYKSIQARAISKLAPNELGALAPDIIYNDVYKVSFEPIGQRGRDALKLYAHIENVGDMVFDYGYAKRKSNLTK